MFICRWILSPMRPLNEQAPPVKLGLNSSIVDRFLAPCDADDGTRGLLMLSQPLSKSPSEGKTIGKICLANIICGVLRLCGIFFRALYTSLY
jgi:hypothetical protein